MTAPPMQDVRRLQLCSLFTLMDELGKQLLHRFHCAKPHVARLWLCQQTGSPSLGGAASLGSLKQTLQFSTSPSPLLLGWDSLEALT